MAIHSEKERDNGFSSFFCWSLLVGQAVLDYVYGFYATRSLLRAVVLQPLVDAGTPQCSN